MAILRRGLDAGVTHQLLDHVDGYAVVKQLGTERIAQQVRVDAARHGCALREPVETAAQDNEAVAACVTVLLSNANFTDLVLRDLMQPESAAFFKARLVTAYHVVMSLMKLQAYDRQHGSLTDAGRHLPQCLLDEPDVRWLRTQKRLRNVLVHYRTDGLLESALILGQPLFGLIEALVPDQTFETVNPLLDRVLRIICDLLQEVVAP